MKGTDVVIIIVGLDAWHYVEQCLDSLSRVDWGHLTQQTIYVDNASRDGSAEKVREKFGDVDVIANATNIGFCRACNQAVAKSASRYVFYLNDDTIVMPDTIPRLIRFLDSTPIATAAGCRVFYGDMTEQWSARRFPTWKNALFGRRSLLTKWFPNAKVVRHYLFKDQIDQGIPFAVDWIPGSCSLVRREAVDKVGGLPEDLHYWSDAVFCDRLNRIAGGSIYIVPESRLIHFEGRGSGTKTRVLSNWLIKDFHRGAYTFYCEHFQLGPNHPARWLAASGLAARAGLMIFVNWVKSAPHRD